MSAFAASTSAFNRFPDAAINAEPFFRSRTLLFLSYRDSRSSTSYPPRQQSQSGQWKGKGRAVDEEETVGLLGKQKNLENGVMETSSLPPSWVHSSEEVEQIIEQIEPKINMLDKLHAKHLLPGFADRSSEEQRIRSLTSEITSLFRKSHVHIQKIQSIALSLQPSGDAKVAENAQLGLAAKIQSLSSQFRKKQSVYLKRLKGYEIQTSDSHTGDSLVAVDDDEQLVKSSLQAVEQETDSSIAQRDKEIAGIAASISDLAELFRDLNMMVIDQGTMLDRIDYNVENMSQNVHAAAEELKTATKHQKRSGKRQLIFLLILLIFGAIVLLIYKPRSRAPPPATPAPSPDNTIDIS